MGWNEKINIRTSKQLGVVPKNTVLAQKESYIKDWNSLSADEKKVHEKQKEGQQHLLNMPMFK